MQPRTGGIRGDDGIRQPEFVDEGGDGAPAGGEALRAGVEGDAGDVVRADTSADRVGRLHDERRESDVNQLASSRQSGGTPADDDDVECGRLAHAPSSCTSSTTRVSTSGSVSGATP